MAEQISIDVNKLDEIIIVGLKYHANILKKCIQDELTNQPRSLSDDHTRVRAVNLDDMFADLSYINEVLRYFGSTKVGFQEGFE